MSYVVLARKYRPRTFGQMVGQDHVVQALGNALQQQRLHHAYLFTGTRGIGKTTVSRILAKSLNCTGPDGQGGITAQPCGVCQACTEIDADRYIDYIEMDAASNGGKDEIRDLIERAAYKPGIGRFKVFMIDEAHQLSKDAFNALLKTLEEPPEYLKFVLATTDPDKVLPTVLSRCLQFNLRPMAPDTVQLHLAQVLQAEGIEADAASLRLLARAARGSMRDGLSLTDQAIAYGGGRLEESVVRTMLGSVDRGHAARLVEALARRDGPAVLAAVDALRGQGLSAAGTLDEMITLLQQMAVLQVVPGSLDETDPEHAETLRLSALLPADETQLLYSMVLHGRQELNLAPDEYAGLTMTLLRLFAFPPASGSPPALPPAPSTARAGAPVPPKAVALRVEPRVAVATAPVAPSRPAAVAAPPRPPAAAQPAAAQTGAAQPASPAVGVKASTALPSALPSAPSSALQSAPTEPVAVSATPAGPAVGGATPLDDQWADTVRRLIDAQAISALVRELACQAQLVAVESAGGADGDVRWTLRVEREMLRTATLADKLQAALCQTLGQPLKLLLQPGVATDSVALRDAAERERRQRLAEQTIRDDPLVQQMLAQFSTARIVPGSIKPA